jgi:sec-independent protein translocase protein TatC
MKGLRTLDPLIKPFWDHLQDLRLVLIQSAVFLAIGWVAAIPLAPRMLAWLRDPYVRAGLENVVSLRVAQVGGGFDIMTRVVCWSGLLFSLPFILVVAGRFVFPGLSARERRLVCLGGGVSIGLFIIGVWMAHRWTLPVAFQLMRQIEVWMGTPAIFWETGNYVSFVLTLLLAFGVAFQFPMLVFILGAVGIVNSTQLRDKRRHVIVGLLVVAMLMTPGPDPFSQVLMAAPLIVFYETAIGLVWLRERRRLSERGARLSQDRTGGLRT